MSREKYDQVTSSYMGVRLTVQCTDPQDPFFRARDFFPQANPQGFTIGRSGSNDLILSAMAVSDYHCRIFAQGPYFYLEDAGSQSGTFLNDQRINPGFPSPVKSGNQIRIGHYTISVGMGREAFLPSQQQLDDATYDLHGAALEGQLGASDSPQLEVVSGPKKGVSVVLQVYQDCVVGRGKECQLVLPDTAISREHLVFKRDWSGVTVRDLNSRNGALLNGKPLPKNKDVDIENGDEIGLGHHLIVFRSPEVDPAQVDWSKQAIDQDVTLPPSALSPEMQAAAAQMRKIAAARRKQTGSTPAMSTEQPPAKPSVTVQESLKQEAKITRKKEPEEDLEEPMSGFYHAPPEEMKAAMREHAAMMKKTGASPVNQAGSQTSTNTTKEKKQTRAKATLTASKPGQWKKKMVWAMLGLSLTILGAVLTLHFLSR